MKSLAFALMAAVASLMIAGLRVPAQEGAPARESQATERPPGTSPDPREHDHDGPGGPPDRRPEPGDDRRAIGPGHGGEMRGPETHPGERRTVGDRGNPERRELRRQLETSRRELGELESLGREAEAREVRDRIGNLERRLDRLNREGRDSGNRGPRSGPSEGPTPRQGKIEHVRVAIDHLHAAGLHDVADRLSRELEVRQRRDGVGGGGFQGGGGNPDRRGGPGPDREGNGGPNANDRGERMVPPAIQDQLNDLRQQLAELRRRLDEARPGGR